MYQTRRAEMPVVVKNLLIINVLLFVFTQLGEARGLDLTHWLGLHYFEADSFALHQLITYMFMHGGLMHLFSNMFGLYMFGRILEQVWGAKRFLIYYMVTGIGAGFVQELVWYFEFHESLQAGFAYIEQLKVVNELGASDQLTYLMSHLDRYVTVGASGSLFGILLAFGMLFPNTELMLLFFPIPIKAKYFVVLYGVYELYAGVSRFEGDSIAHFAHLGGMIFGFILLRYWRVKRDRFY